MIAETVDLYSLFLWSVPVMAIMYALAASSYECMESRIQPVIQWDEIRRRMRKVKNLLQEIQQRNHYRQLYKGKKIHLQENTRLYGFCMCGRPTEYWLAGQRSCNSYFACGPDESLVREYQKLSHEIYELVRH